MDVFRGIRSLVVFFCVLELSEIVCIYLKHDYVELSGGRVVRSQNKQVCRII